MPPKLQTPGKLSSARKLSRLAVRLRDPEWRRYGRFSLPANCVFSMPEPV
jgi:hypothetical protein